MVFIELKRLVFVMDEKSVYRVNMNDNIIIVQNEKCVLVHLEHRMQVIP